MRALSRPAWLLLLLVLLARVASVCLTPIIDDDSVAIMVAALDMARDGTPSPAYPLPVAAVAACFALAGDHLWLARLPQALASVALVALLLVAGRRVGPRAALAAAALFAGLPIAAVYGTIAKPYALMTLAVTGGALLFGDAVERDCRRRAALAGLCFAGAFACYTFAVLAVAPLAILAAAGLRARHRRWLAPALAALAGFAVPAAALLGWRVHVLGGAALNDFAIDWRWAIATAVWSRQWVGLVDAWGAGLAWFAPLLWHPEAVRRLGPTGVYAALLLAILIPFQAANPVNHYPRVLLPALPLACLLTGTALATLLESDRPAALAWLTVGLAGWLAPTDVASGTGVALALVGCALAYRLLACLPWAPARHLHPAWCLAALLGLLPGARALAVQAAVYQPRLELLRQAGVAGVVGAGDVAALVADGAVPGLLDLEADELTRALHGDLLPVLRARRLSHLVIPHDRRELVAALGALRSPEAARALLARLDGPEFDRLADTDHGALFHARGVPTRPLDDDQRARLARFDPATALRPPMPRLTIDGADAVADPGGRDDLLLNGRLLKGRTRVPLPADGRAVIRDGAGRVLRAVRLRR